MIALTACGILTFSSSFFLGLFLIALNLKFPHFEIMADLN